MTPGGFGAAERALAWIRANTLDSSGVRVHNGHVAAYPEVTGYLIPTLLRHGEHALAEQYARWLVSIQHEHGSFADPDQGHPHVFDTAQVLRGLLAIRKRVPAAQHAAEKTARWLLQQAGDGSSGFGARYDGAIPETVHLYALPPLLEAIECFGMAASRTVVSRATEHYLSRPDLLRPSTLTHFLAYEWQALLELGRLDEARTFLPTALSLQAQDGSFAATKDARWVCCTGVAQLAWCLYSLECREPADRAMDWLRRNQSPSGGWPGSIGPGADYFASVEPAWGVKYFLDAHTACVASTMDSMEGAFPDSIDLHDGRLLAVAACVHPGNRVLDAGCGKGRFLRALKQLDPSLQLDGVDISPALLRHVGPAAETRVGFLEDVPFPDHSFDCAYAIEALEHSPNMAAAVAELCRVVRPGGSVVIIDKELDSWGRFDCPPWERWPSREELTALLRRYCDHVEVRAVSYDTHEADGLMCAWTARVRETHVAARTGCLLVVPEDSPRDLAEKFGGLARLSGYYNPGGVFERATLIDWGRGAGWGELGQDILKLPPVPGVEAWLQACQLLNEKADPGIADISAGWPGLPESWKAAIAAQRPSCLRVYGARWSLWLGLELKRALGVPLLVSLHNVSGLSRDLLEHADLVMAVSDTVAAKAIELGAAPGRVVTVHNRVNRELFTPDGPPAEGPTGNLRLLCVARDVPQKNLDNLLAACELANQKLPVALTLLHIGSSTRDWSRWPFVVHMDQLEHDKLPAWFRWADAFIMPSRWEGFGIVLIEALACGTPCITSNREPMSGIVQDRWNGLLVNPEDPADIARAIEQMWDSTTRARLAAPARTATEPYDTARIERREAGLYAELLEPRFPRLSVVLPTYNRARLVRSAVLNALAQDYPDLELLVVNDGSTDGTRELLDDLAATLKDPRLRVLHQTNSRLPKALNAGFAAATGELLTWTSDDNAFLPGALKAMARELMLDQDAGMVFADYRVVGDNGDQRDVHTGPVESLPERNVIGACFLYRRSAAAAAGDYDPNRELAEDYDYWLRLSKVARLVHLSRSLYLYGDTPDSLSRRRPADVQAAALALQAGSSAPAALRQQLIRLAGAYKSQGLPWKSLSVGLQLIRQAPLSGAGYKAVARALTPMPLLRLTRRLRGADAG